MALSPGQLDFFAEFIKKESGIVYEKSNHYQLEQRLEKIADQLSLKDSTELFLKASREGIVGDFKMLLLDQATNNETSFFRDPKIYNAFEKHILPKICEDHPKALLYRIWSCATSFGQEPYSLAMLVTDFANARPGIPRFEIQGTDYSETAVKRTKEGRYSQLEVQRGLPTPLLVKHFTKSEDNYWTLSPAIRSMVSVKKYNLLDSFAGMGLFHVIFCRYVLIYQDVEKKKDIIQRIVKQLAPKGFLVLGASESALGLSSELDQVLFDGVVFYQKK